jgi:hypothetical protein
MPGRWAKLRTIFPVLRMDVNEEESGGRVLI